MPDEYSAADFQRLTYHVQEGLLVHLLRELNNEHFLPQASKLNVTFGADETSSDYSCCLSVAHVWIDNPDLGEFFALDSTGQDRWALNHLRLALLTAAERQGVSCDSVERAVTRAHNDGLLLRYSIKKLSRMHPGRKLKFNVVRAIQRGGESWFVEVCDRTDTLLESFPIFENTYYIRAAGALKKSRWRGDTFLLCDSGGRIRFQKSSKRLLEKYVG